MFLSPFIHLEGISSLASSSQIGLEGLRPDGAREPCDQDDQLVLDVFWAADSRSIDTERIVCIRLPSPRGRRRCHPEPATTSVGWPVYPAFPNSRHEAAIDGACC